MKAVCNFVNQTNPQKKLFGNSSCHFEFYLVQKKHCTKFVLQHVTTKKGSINQNQDSLTKTKFLASRLAACTTGVCSIIQASLMIILPNNKTILTVSTTVELSSARQFGRQSANKMLLVHNKIAAAAVIAAGS